MVRLAKSTTSGRLLKHPTSGHLILNTPAAYKLTPCVELVADCICCTANTTPKYWTVYPADIEIDTGCRSGTGCSRNCSYLNLEAAYVVEHVDGCTWELWDTSPDTDLVSYPATTDCTGTSYNAPRLWVRFRCYQVDEEAPAGPYYYALAIKIYTYDGETQKDDFGIYAELTADQFDDAIDCTAYTHTHDNDSTAWNYTWIGKNGSAIVVPGDRITPGVRCPGGNPIYTDTDLSAAVGKVVELDDGVCYKVENNPDCIANQGAVTVVQTCDDCPDCCADTC